MQADARKRCKPAGGRWRTIFLSMLVAWVQAVQDSRWEAVRTSKNMGERPSVQGGWLLWSNPRGNVCVHRIVGDPFITHCGIHGRCTEEFY